MTQKRIGMGLVAPAAAVTRDVGATVAQNDNDRGIAPALRLTCNTPRTIDGSGEGRTAAPGKPRQIALGPHHCSLPVERARRQTIRRW